MTYLDITSCKTDPDIWMREAQKDEGTPFWEYGLLYVENALVISNRGEYVIRKEIETYFYVKDGSIGPPSIYLGNKDYKITLENGVETWSLRSSQYVQAEVANVEDYLTNNGK